LNNQLNQSFKIGLLFISCFFILLSCRPQKNNSSGNSKKKSESSGGNIWKFRGTIEIEDNPNYTKIFQTALRKKRPIFISFYTDWCTTCPFMNDEMIRKQPIVKLLEDEFVSYIVDAESAGGYKLANEYKIAAYPTILLLNSEGEEISRYVGLADEYKVMQLSKSAIIAEEKFQKKKEKERNK